MKLKQLTIKDVEYTAHRLAAETMSWSEPIPDFSTRYTNALERCIGAPFQTFGGRQLYPGLIRKASILFYLMIKNHPFQNGNKRIAITTLLSFMAKNGKWIKVDPETLYRTAVWVAESPAEFKDQVVKAFSGFVQKYIERRIK